MGAIGLPEAIFLGLLIAVVVIVAMVPIALVVLALRVLRWKKAARAAQVNTSDVAHL